jgi:hypothetical protein
MVRNFVLFGSPLGSQEILALERNDRISLRVGASNFIRNLVLHTSTPSKWVTQQLNKGVAWAHQLTGEDLNDPETTFQYCRFQFPRNYLVSDSWATCIVHLLLCGVACAFAFVRPLRNLQFNAYIGLTVASVLFFCFFLRWQAWHARIHMTWFLLLAPVTAILIIRELPPWTIRFSSLALLALAGATIVANSSQPVFQAAYWRLPREQRYFALGAEETNRELLRLANTIIASKCRNIGLKADSCEVEYPLWVMLRNRGFQGRIDRCYVGNVSARLPNSGPGPEMIISTFDIVPPAVAESFPRREKYGNLTALWPDHDVLAAGRR